MISPKNATPVPAADRLAELGASIAARPYARRSMSQSNEIIRVLLADDHVIVREGLRLLLRSAPDITVVGDAENGTSALSLAQQLAPDVVVLDLDMPGGDGATALRAIQEKTPSVRVLILTMHAEHEKLAQIDVPQVRDVFIRDRAENDPFVHP